MSEDTYVPEPWLTRDRPSWLVRAQRTEGDYYVWLFGQLLSSMGEVILRVPEPQGLQELRVAWAYLCRIGKIAAKAGEIQRSPHLADVTHLPPERVGVLVMVSWFSTDELLWSWFVRTGESLGFDPDALLAEARAEGATADYAD